MIPKEDKTTQCFYDFLMVSWVVISRFFNESPKNLIRWIIPWSFKFTPVRGGLDLEIKSVSSGFKYWYSFRSISLRFPTVCSLSVDVLSWTSHHQTGWHRQCQKSGISVIIGLQNPKCFDTKKGKSNGRWCTSHDIRHVKLWDLCWGKWVNAMTSAMLIFYGDDNIGENAALRRIPMIRVTI